MNAAGALQSGARDDVDAVQRSAMLALYQACETNGPGRLVQVSAPGVSADASTEFYRTKAVADQALMESGLDWTILRPGLVLAEDSYGGTSLLRLLAAIPVVQPLALANAPVQTVGRADVARLAADAVEGAFSRQAFDLVETEPQTLETVLLAIRDWLGFAPPALVIHLPRFLARPMAMAGDMAGWLGWRPALRTTALRVLEDGVTGDPDPLRAATGQPLSSLAETLNRLPRSADHARQARFMLLMPVLLVLFSLFWIASGIIGLIQMDAARSVIAGRVPDGAAMPFVILGSLADIAIGLCLLVRRFARAACLAAVMLSAGYLVAASLVVPALWADPLGPLTKIIPVIAAALLLREIIPGGHRAAR